MSTESQGGKTSTGKPGAGRVLTLAGIAVVIAIAFVILNVQGTGIGPVAPTIRTINDYNAAVDDAETRSSVAFQKFDRGEPLTAGERSGLLQAAKDFEAMYGFDPSKFNHALGAGKAYLELGDEVNADKWLQICIKNRPADQPPELDYPQSFYVQTLAEAHYLRALLLFNDHQYSQSFEEAAIAANAVPQSAVYVAAEASAKLQVGDENAAKRYVRAALKIDRKNAKALGLAQYLGVSAP